MYDSSAVFLYSLYFCATMKTPPLVFASSFVKMSLLEEPCRTFTRVADGYYHFTDFVKIVICSLPVSVSQSVLSWTDVTTGLHFLLCNSNESPTGGLPFYHYHCSFSFIPTFGFPIFYSKCRDSTDLIRYFPVWGQWLGLFLFPIFQR